MFSTASDASAAIFDMYTLGATLWKSDVMQDGDQVPHAVLTNPSRSTSPGSAVSLRSGRDDDTSPRFIRGTYVETAFDAASSCQNSPSDTSFGGADIRVDDLDAPFGLEHMVESVLGDADSPAKVCLTAGAGNGSLSFVDTNPGVHDPVQFSHTPAHLATPFATSVDSTWDSIVRSLGMSAPPHVASPSSVFELPEATKMNWTEHSSSELFTHAALAHQYGQHQFYQQEVEPVAIPSIGSLAETVAIPSTDTLAESVPIMSVGSLAHQSGSCRPCAFVHSKGCMNGAQCTYCHLCSPQERKVRRKEMKVLKRKVKAAMSTTENAP
eukprot:TRINITY_DN3374_c0_g1_i1.p1 TRINITY_DN3374_c0_g1~~TRINITY_DN3374_c0_g1_i1.p1  ORF type:complete len:325 (-),score=39.95 TRINITY_DN3374_c0_g1_i1:348-1322(-)